MPGLARKILICAAADGLLLHPVPARKDQRVAPSVKIRYVDATLSLTSRDQAAESAKQQQQQQQAASFEAFGIVGLILVSRFSYLVSITKRQQVATIRGSPVYVVTEVALTPCASYDEAHRSVVSTADSLKVQAPSYITDEDSDSSSDNDNDNDHGTRPAGEEDVGSPLWADDGGVLDDASTPTDRNALPPSQTKGEAGNSIAEDVISRRGSYGRFAQRWFSRSGWLQEQKRLMGLTGNKTADIIDEEATAEQPSEHSPPPTSMPGSKVESAPETASSTPPPQLADPGTGSSGGSGSSGSDEDSAVTSLIPKLLRTAHMFFGASRAFYFSYDYDITRSVAKQPTSRWSSLPLHKRVDSLYFWNSHTLQPFVDAGADAFALPLMQGFVAQRSFVVDSDPPQVDEVGKDALELDDLSYRPGGAASPKQPTSPTSPTRPMSPMSLRASSETERRASEKEFDVTLISRRSVKRAGLRYLRRGVDEDGNVANAVETEQILCPTVVNQVADPSSLYTQQQQQAEQHVYSFVQVRGSIPLFWTQSPFSLKPVPVIQHALDLNYSALRSHFDGLRREYGGLQVVNLVEKHGVEAALGTQFERSVQQYNDDADEDKAPLAFEWFDFHSACKGMKFENVSLLLGRMARKLDAFGSTVEEVGVGGGGDGTDSPGGTIRSTTSSHYARTVARQQTGVLRTNCMDCLDRTNVCQSSFAKYMLDAQLKEQGFDMAAQHDQENAWFNTLWADNGDAVSKQYASTAAMKGDYTRTRRRDYRGALTDAGLSLTRFFNGIINDFFLQTTIDFLLGNVTDKIFDEFEANMMTKDPALSMEKMREQAIDLCQRRVVADESEEFIGGWTLVAPHDADVSLVAPPFEEVVLLLTDAALYLCRFDWNLDKLSSFERVDLAHVETITVGTYIVSTVSPMQMDDERNVGFAVSYRPGRNDILRINTRSLSSVHLGDGEGASASASQSQSHPPTAAETLSTSIANFLHMRAASPVPKRLAFKALHADTSTPAGKSAVGKRTEKEQIAAIVGEIERLVRLNRPPPPPPATATAAGTERPSIIVAGDIVSLAEARRSTGLLGHLGHSLKKLVWA